MNCSENVVKGDYVTEAEKKSCCPSPLSFCFLYVFGASSVLAAFFV